MSKSREERMSRKVVLEHLVSEFVKEQLNGEYKRKTKTRKKIYERTKRGL